MSSFFGSERRGAEYRHCGNLELFLSREHRQMLVEAASDSIEPWQVEMRWNTMTDNLRERGYQDISNRAKNNSPQARMLHLRAGSPSRRLEGEGQGHGSFVPEV